MPLSKKQLQRLIRLVAQLKENRYPNCTSFAAAMQKVDIDENLNISCTAKTIFRDIQILKNDFDAPSNLIKHAMVTILLIMGGTFLVRKFTMIPKCLLQSLGQELRNIFSRSR